MCYRWSNPHADDELEIYTKTPPINCSNIEVTCAGTLVFDFGAELAGWLEVDIPDLADNAITLGVSEHKNPAYTAEHRNGIESYELYWIFSLVDYYNHTSDKIGVQSLMPQALSRLDHAYEIYGTNPNLGYFGWDERLGAGFENPNIAENQNAYKMLCIRAWREFAEVLRDFGERELAERYAGYADEKSAKLALNFAESFGIHAAADAIKAGRELYDKHFGNRVNRLSYSPFNQYFLLQAMGKVGAYDDALSSILDMFGGQIEYGGTTFFEIYRPQWNAAIGQNGAPPNCQVGFTSLAHPWGAGVLHWLSEEILGIKPLAPGFAKVRIAPKLPCGLTQISGKIPTPHGDIEVNVNTKIGEYTHKIPHGISAEILEPQVIEDRPQPEYIYPAEFVAGTDKLPSGFSEQPDFVKNISYRLAKECDWCRYTNGVEPCAQSMTVDIELNEPQDYEVALWFLDKDKQGRRQLIDMFDFESFDLIAPSKLVSSFSGGCYMIYRYSKSARFRINHIKGDNAVLCGVWARAK